MNVSIQEIKAFETLLYAREIVDHGMYAMGSERRMELVFPLGTAVIDEDDSIVYRGDGVIEGGVTTEDTLLESIFPDSAGERSFRFAVDPTTSKFAIFELVGGNWTVVNAFGSMITDEFVSTIPMGGLQVIGDDGYRYNIARTSPVGNGISAVLGNYSSTTYIVSNIGGVYHAYETQTVHVDAINESTTPFSSTTLSKTATPTLGLMQYGGADWMGGKFYLASAPTVTEDRLVRSWATSSTGKILHQTIPELHWNSTDDKAWLKNHGAEPISFVAGQDWISLPTSIPLPTSPETGVVTFRWEFKAEVEGLGSATAPKMDWATEEIVVERVATREWVADSAAGQTYREIGSSSTPEELVVGKGENLIVKELSGSITVSPAIGVKSFTVRDKGDFLSDTNSVVAQLTPDSSVTMVRGGDNVLFNILADGTCSYYNYRTGLGGAV